MRAAAPAPDMTEAIDAPLDKTTWLSLPWIREMRLRGDFISQIEAILIDLGLTGAALDNELNRLDTRKIARAAARRYTPELERLQRFTKRGPGRPKGQANLLMRLLLDGVKKRHLSPKRPLSAKTINEAIKDYLEPRVHGGVVDDLKDMRHPKTKRFDTRVTWITKRGKSSNAWVSDIAKRLRRHLPSPP
jgi:hypothetical protein